MFSLDRTQRSIPEYYAQQTDLSRASGDLGIDASFVLSDFVAFLIKQRHTEFLFFFLKHILHFCISYVATDQSKTIRFLLERVAVRDFKHTGISDGIRIFSAFSPILETIWVNFSRDNGPFM